MVLIHNESIGLAPVIRGHIRVKLTDNIFEKNPTGLSTALVYRIFFKLRNTFKLYYSSDANIIYTSYVLTKQHTRFMLTGN